MSAKPAFVFVHGYWHNEDSWKHLVPALAAQGFVSRKLDLPGAGRNAKMPDAFFRRPIDAAAFASEPSPNAGVTQEERTEAVLEAIRAIGGPVVLVGHSMGGATISDVAEAAPETLAAVVYLTAFMLPPGMPPIAMIQHETMSSALVPGLFRADPAQVGALRIDPGSDDTEYRAQLKAAFYGDVGDADFAEAVLGLHSDEPVTTALRPSVVTRERYGRVPRHYIRCEDDCAITPAGQDRMIVLMDEAMGDRTTTHTLAASHSPFFSRPADLADLLVRIGS